jgi:DMSO/TMAO reductase YedYZ molybdopterin-dependent catalytic subunit
MSGKSGSSGLLVIFYILLCFLAFSGCISERDTQETYNVSEETTVYEGKQLTPISEQRNNAIKGTQYIDMDTYELQVYGMVANPLNLS